MNCAIAFFGIDRRLDLTSSSILSMIVEPARRNFHVDVVSHLWSPNAIANARSGEKDLLGAPRIDLLPAGQHCVEAPLDMARDERFRRIAALGDFWNDGGRSLANLYHQLVSLERATELALAGEPDCVAFVRPDLIYHDSWEGLFSAVQAGVSDTVYLPHWQPHGGLNDRFALCVGERAIRAYGGRLRLAEEFCHEFGSPLHGEKLVRQALAGASISIRRFQQRASRVRLNGRTVDEDFSARGWKPALRVLAGRIRKSIIPSVGTR